MPSHSPTFALALLVLLPFTGACSIDLTRHRPSGQDAALSEAGGADLSDQGAEAWLDACVPSNGGVEICDGLDNDCNGTPDDGFNLKTDPKNCGACGNVCKTPNATSACVAGACAVSACDKDKDGNTTHWNTDGNWKTGCNYPCLISAGGHEVCDGKDNDCDKLKDELCASLSLLYRFGDLGTKGNWPIVHNLARNDAMGLAAGGASLAWGSTSAGVSGEGSDGYAVSFNGTDGQVAVTPTKYQQVFDCDTAAGWSGFGTSVFHESSKKKEGTYSLKVAGKTNSLGHLMAYSGAAKDLSQWTNSKQELDGYLTFWVFISDANHSKLAVLEIGNKNNAQNAAWWKVDKHVLGPKEGAFSTGWNLVALPFASAIYTDKALTDWSNVVWVQIFTNVKNDPGNANYFLFDDFRVEKDLSQRFTRFTVMAWVRPSAIKSWGYIFHKHDDMPGMGTDKTGNQWWFTPGNNINLFSTHTVKAGKWTHLAMTYNGTIFTAYQDGKSVGQSKASFTPGGRARIGADNVAGRFFSGLVDEVAIYTRAMGQAELQRYVGLFSP